MHFLVFHDSRIDFLLPLEWVSGITAEKHYRLKNASLCLHVSVPAESQDTWVLNQSRVIVHNKVLKSSFINKVDYSPENASLCINKLANNDSGQYTISFVHLERLISHTHTLEVQGKCFHSTQVRLRSMYPLVGRTTTCR